MTAGDLPSDEEWSAPPVPTTPPPASAVRRSQSGPDRRWPTLPGRRWYVYVDDRPIGYLELCGLDRRSSFKWVPYTLSGGRLAGAWPLTSAQDILVHFDETGRSPMRVCSVCGRRLRHRRGDPDEHSALCPLVVGVIAR